jgi:hypothetical protein
MGLKITFVFAIRHYAGNDLKREPSLHRACDLEANASFPAEPIGGRLVDSALAGDWGFHGLSAYP